MREILFKAKYKYDGEWKVGGIVHQTDFYGLKVDKYFIIDGTETEDNDIGYNYEVIPETVSQFTGLYDKNGVRIWENDIVRYTDLAFNPNIGRFENMIFTSAVTYNLDNGCFSPFEPDTFESYIRAENVEVIGNRFDNPDLLKGE